MKVLIVSHLPVATQNNMGKTFLSLFSEFQRQELCQLYIYPAIPDVDRCNAYYRVTDKEILRSIVTLKAPGGELDSALIQPNQGLYEEPEDEGFYRNTKNKSPVRRMLRDGMWAMSRWYSAALQCWLDREQPDCIFLAPGPAKFIYNVALKISKKRQIPIVTYVCDEYYFVRPPKGLPGRLRLRSLQRKIRETLGKSAHLVVICDELKEEYENFFHIPTTTLMTGTAYPIAKAAEESTPKTISYFGNIRCNRYLSLTRIGKALDRLNAEGGDYRLKIYTSEKDETFLAPLKAVGSIELCGFVTGEAFDRAFAQAELLLHTEAFDEAGIDAVRHSVSTKIADSLACGKPLLAYGPKEVASMGHLLRNRCALTATSEEELLPMLRTAFQDAAQRRQVVEQALKVAEQYHDSDKNGKRLREIIAGR